MRGSGPDGLVVAPSPKEVRWISGSSSAAFKTVDLLLVLFFVGFFVLGFAQGTIRRLIGLASILFSFLFAANVAEPLGGFLADATGRTCPSSTAT